MIELSSEIQSIIYNGIRRKCGCVYRKQISNDFDNDHRETILHYLILVIDPIKVAIKRFADE